MSKFKVLKNQLIRGAISRGKVVSREDSVELVVGAKGLWTWMHQKEGIASTSASDIAKFNRRLKRLRPKAALSYKNDQGKSIAFVGELESFSRTGKKYRLKISTFDSLKVKKEPELLRFAGESRLRRHNRALKKRQEFARQEDVVDIQLGLSSYTQKKVDRIFKNAPGIGAQSRRTAELDANHNPILVRKNRDFSSIEYSKIIPLKRTGTTLQLDFKATPSLSGEVTYPSENLLDLLDPDEYSITVATDIELLAAAKVVFPIGGGWTEGQRVGSVIPISDRYKIEAPDPITGIGKVSLRPTLKWQAEFSSDNMESSPWLEYNVSKGYGFEVHARGLNVSVDANHSPFRSGLDWSPGIFGDCFCDMSAEIVPGLELAWEIGVSPSWPVLGKVLPRKTIATLLGSIENPLGVNLEIYDAADAYLSSRGVAGIGVKLFPSVFDEEISRDFEIYRARSGNLFA